MVAGITFGTAIGYGAYTNNQSILLCKIFKSRSFSIKINL